jgi:hypothetical protein
MRRQHTALVGNHGQGTASRFDLERATLLDTFPAWKGVEPRVS